MVQSYLPEYAAGTLDTAAVAVVQRHLAIGCQACLDEIFARPVGLPRTVVATVLPPPIPARRTVPLWWIAAGVVAAAALVTAVVVRDLRAARVHREETVRRMVELDDVRAERDDLAGRVRALDRTLADLRTEATERADVAAARDDLQGRLETAEARVGALTLSLARRDRELDRLAAANGVSGPLHDFLATPGVRVMALEPVPPVQGARGYVLWSPSRPLVLLYGFGLVPLPAGGSYRARVTMGDDTPMSVTSLTATERGTVTVAVLLPEDESRGGVARVELVRDPDGEPVLAAAADAGAGG